MINSDGLEPLSEADEWQVVEGQPDVRGWPVQCSTRTRIGVVTELLVDTRARKARYLVVRLDPGEERLPGQNVLIPVGVAQIQDDEDVVLIPSLEPRQVATLPLYTPEGFGREHENAVRACLGDRCDPSPDFYDHPHFDEHRMYTRRRRRRTTDRRTPAST